MINDNLRLSEGHQRVVRGELLDNFCLMTNLLPESCQNKMTAQRLSRYLKVVTGRKMLLKGCHKAVIGLSHGRHNGSHWIVIRLSRKQKWYCEEQRLSIRQHFDNFTHSLTTF